MWNMYFDAWIKMQEKKRIHSRFSETACKMSLTLFPLVQWQFFLNECSTLLFCSVLIRMFSFYCLYLPKRTFHCHFHLCYVIFNVFEMCVLCVIVRVNFGWMNVSHSKSMIWNLKSQKNIIKISRLWKVSTIFWLFILTIKLKISFK